MSGALAGLIRLHRWQLDEKRRALADLESLAARLTGEIAKLDGELARESALAAEQPEPMVGFAAYLEATRGRRQRLTASLSQVQAQIAAATEDIRSAFQDLKKYELAAADRHNRAKAKERRRETAYLDEVGATGHQRRKNSGSAA
jgi:chromosome segregation ATPase